MTYPSFHDFFHSLWGIPPFPWQEMLADRASNRSWPKALDLPTAAGKTTCIEVAIYALAAQAGTPLAARTAPRRTWFVVDRRIVVDEAFDRAAVVARKLAEADDGPLKEVADRLRLLGGTERPLAVARLRGGTFRDDGWARIPSQPAIITSTVDQLGSRLLFRGYGHSSLTASIFAGLAANDSLILLDEAHCSIPFMETLCAIEKYRGKDWAETPISTPFAFSVLSATPPSGIPRDSLFPGDERTQALDHPVLQARLTASKPAEMLVVKKSKSKNDTTVLVGKAVDRALEYAEEHGKRRVAVIVNRVRSAERIARLLRERAAGKADVVLLTGRMRPLDRDRLVKRWSPFLKSSSPCEPERPVILVSTQCIEVGADFSFDALVTEVASLDALRQRFGRLNRMGLLGEAPATILARERDIGPGKSDAIYGPAVSNCWRVLSERALESSDGGKNKILTVDFGFETLNGLLADVDDLSPCLAPRPKAPVLLPAHLDMLCQTAPRPYHEPDVRLFLHGNEPAMPESRVAWRADLDEQNLDFWTEAVALCPPCHGETMSVPLRRLRDWLDGVEPRVDEPADADIESVQGGDDKHRKRGHATQQRHVVLWRGRDACKVTSKSSDIRPNDIVVVPSSYGMEGIGQGGGEPGETVPDLWEQAREAAGQSTALRISRNAVSAFPESETLSHLVQAAEADETDESAIREAIDTVLSSGPDEDAAAPPSWFLDALRKTRGGRIERNPAGGIAIFARKGPSPSAETDLFADDDDLLSMAGKRASVPRHSESVARAASKLAKLCLPEPYAGTLTFSGRWHDVGKIEERFKVFLHNGNVIEAALGEPLAKSDQMPISPVRRRAIREACGLPEGFRHEMLSYQLAERFAGLSSDRDSADLALHLIASHHGHARPFAPVCVDADPVSVTGNHYGVPIDLSADERIRLVPPHDPGSGVSDRFWQLTRKYGWWGLAYLEAVLRLADWYGSQWMIADD